MNAEHHAPLAIVVVDDHPLFTDGLRYQLEAIVPSARVECFGTLREACAALDSELSCGLILLDLALPDAQGFEALTRLRAIRPDVPAVILSGMDEARLIVQCLEHGAAGFIPKSASQRRTVHALEHVLSGGVYVPEEVASYAGVDLARVRDVASRARARFAGAAADPDRQSPSMSGSGARRAVQSGAASLASAAGGASGTGARPGIDPSALGLTARQTDVLDLMVLGLPNKLICRRLKLAEGTVKVHVSAVLRALGVRNRTQAVIAASQLGLRLGKRR